MITNKENSLTKEEFLEQNKDFLEKYTELINGEKFVSGSLGNDDDKKKIDFPGIYAILEDNKVFYIGSSFGRRIKKRLGEHLDGDETHTSIAKYLMETRNIDKAKAKELLKTFDFIAFQCKSLEYQLINNTPGLINKSCNHKSNEKTIND